MLNWRPDDDFCSFLTILRENKEEPIVEVSFKVGDKVKIAPGSGVASGKSATIVDKSEIKLDGRGIPTNVHGAYRPVNWFEQVAIKLEDGTYDVMFKNRLMAEGKERPKVRDVPGTMKPKAKPDIWAEDLGVEDYSEEDLNKPNAKVKSKSQKDPKYAVRKVADKEVQNPVPLKDATQTVTEGIFELLGEVPGISLTDQAAVRAMVQSGKIPVDWPTEEVMIDALSKLEDFVEPAKLGPDVDVKQAYLTHVIVPKALVWDKTRECKEDTRQSLYLCNNCCKTFRADEAICPECLSNIVEKVVQDKAKSKENLTEKVYDVYCTITGRTIGKQERHFTVDAEDEKKAEEKVKVRFPNAVISKVVEEEVKVAEAKIEETRFVVYFTAEGQGKHLEIPAENKEAAEAEVKRDFPDAVIHRIVEESKLGEDFEEEHGLGKGQEAEKGQDWDLTFKYPHDQVQTNPLLDVEGKPFLTYRHPLSGKRVRVFSNYQAKWVESQGAIPVREEPAEKPSRPEEKPTEEPELSEDSREEKTHYKLTNYLGVCGYESKNLTKNWDDVTCKFCQNIKKSGKAYESKVSEQESEVKSKSYTVVGRGLEEEDAKNIAQQKEGSSVVPDEQAEGKFMVMTKVKESKLKEEYKPKVMRSKMIDVMYDLGYSLAGERKDSDAGIRVLEFRKGDDVVEVKLSLEEEKE